MMEFDYMYDSELLKKYAEMEGMDYQSTVKPTMSVVENGIVLPCRESADRAWGRGRLSEN